MAVQGAEREPDRLTTTHKHTEATWERSLSDGVVWFAPTATATQSLSALYWVTAITEDQVATKLQAVHLWEGHTRTHAAL